MNEKKRDKSLLKIKRRSRCYCITVTAVNNHFIGPWTATETTSFLQHSRIEPGRLEDAARNWRKQCNNGKSSDVKKTPRAIQQRVHPWQLTVAGRKVKYAFSHLLDLDNYIVSYREACTTGYLVEPREDRLIDEEQSLLCAIEPSTNLVCLETKRDAVIKCYNSLPLTARCTSASRQSFQLYPPDPMDKTSWSKGFWPSSLSTATSAIKVKDNEENEDVTIKTKRPTRSGKPITLVKYRETLPQVTADSTERLTICVSNDIKTPGNLCATIEVPRQTICKPIFQPEDKKAENTTKGRLLTARCRSLSDAGLTDEPNKSLSDTVTGKGLIDMLPSTNIDMLPSTNNLKLFNGGSHSDILYRPPTPPLTFYESILHDPIARPVSLHTHAPLLTKPHLSRGHRKYRGQSAHKKCINKSLNRRIPSSKWIFVDSNGSFTLDKKYKASPTVEDILNAE